MRFEISPPPKTTINTFVLSPDGRKLIFNARGADGRSSFVAPPDGFAPGPRIAGNRRRDSGSGMVSGQPICCLFWRKAISRRSTLPAGRRRRWRLIAYPAAGISWSRQDVILFGSGGVINRCPASGGDGAPVTALDTKHGERGAGPARSSCRMESTFCITGRATEGAKAASSSARSTPSPPNRDRSACSIAPAGAVYVASSAGGPGILFFLRGEALMSQPFDPSRLELTGHAVQLADRVSSEHLWRFVFGFEQRRAGVRRHGRQHPPIDLVRPGGQGPGPRGRGGGARRTVASPDGTRVAEGREDDKGTWGVWMLIWRAASIRA